MTNEIVADTACGRVRGLARDGCAVWRGIPFAAPPTGARRFLPPEPPAPWTGERDATKFGPVAMQSRDSRIAMMSGISEKTVMSEDCLCLNVFAPLAYADGRKRAVLVWVHGGAFVMGSGSTPLYRGETFATDDLVVVTFNYRIGVLGLLYLGHKDPAYAHGNVCLLDQVAALAWVKQNIAAFGGDPQRVTVMGESAGAVSIATLLGMPAARGLFQAAIVQSGASQLSVPTRADAAAFADGVLADLGVTDLHVLAELPVEKILEAQQRAALAKGLAAFAPYLDGVTVPIDPLAAVRDGSGIAVPILTGTNRDEWTLFAEFIGHAAAVAPLQRAIVERIGEPATAKLLAVYEASDHGVAHGWIDLIGDVAFRIPVILLAEANRAPTYVYRFDFASPGMGGKLGATHALELMFLWRALELPVGQFFLGGSAPGAKELGDHMHATWVAFVKDHAPPAGWPAYATPARPTMLFDVVSRVADDPGSVTRRACTEMLATSRP